MLGNYERQRFTIKRMKGEQIMIFDRNEQKQVVVLLGAGSMGTAIVRRIGAGKTGTRDVLH